METVLIELRRYARQSLCSHGPANQRSRFMALPQHKKLPQPAEGTTF